MSAILACYLLPATAPAQLPSVTQGMPADPVGLACPGRATQARLPTQPRISVGGHLRKAARRVDLVYDLIDAQTETSIDEARITINLRFWPTAIHLSSVTELYVAGKALNGDTVVVKYPLSLPLLSQANSPATGQVIESVVPGQAGAPTTLLREAIFGRDVIQVLGSMKGAPELILLMQYVDSKEVWTLGVTTLLHSFVATPTPPPSGGLGDGQLDAYLNTVRGFEDDVFGNLYLLQDCMSGVAGDSTPFRILYDINQDGLLDGYLSGTAIEWYGLGLGDCVPL
jgi:hypothetical protein